MSIFSKLAAIAKEVNQAANEAVEKKRITECFFIGHSPDVINMYYALPEEERYQFILDLNDMPLVTDTIWAPEAVARQIQEIWDTRNLAADE